ncbi:MAG: zinc-dependent peptidase [Phycisphaerales bacterium]|nr:MAG: zinc-dependent peptidase [Phycisphaerales bacterium]
MTIAKIGIVVIGLTIAFFVLKRATRRARRRRLMARPFPDAWKEIVERNVPLYRRLPEELKQQLRGLVQVFLAEKHFEGCGGQEMTDEIKVTIATQACILLLNRKPTFFPRLRSILVYPHTYVARNTSFDGHIVSDEESSRLGESWQNGPVVLAWDSVRGGTSNVQDAQNVVLHEFAHQLDQEDGTADGAPILAHRSRYVAWARVLGAEYEALQDSKKRHRRSVLDKYGATNPAEFFAVATETFFEKPGQMQKRHPELYNELREHYQLDPARWR